MTHKAIRTGLIKEKFEIALQYTREIEDLKESQEEALQDLEEYGFSRKAVFRVFARLKNSREENEEIDEEIAGLESCLDDSMFGPSEIDREFDDEL